MPVLLFLNELSCATSASPRSANQAMTDWVDLLRAVRRRRDDITLVTHVQLKSLELAGGYYVSHWIAAEAKNVERWRFVRSLQNRAPFRAVIPADMADIEYRHKDRDAEGIGAAHLLNGLAVSLRLEPAWEHSSIAVDRSVLTEDDSGELEMAIDRVDVRHASTLHHADCHRDWLVRHGHDGLCSGLVVWENRDHLYPHLSFLPRVENDMRGLPPHWVRPAAELLFTLEEALADWNPGHAPSQAWKTKVTGESETRQKLCEFTDLDGTVRVFELHGRFTPGPGRIYFRLLPDATARVAYVGRKVGL